MTGAVPGLGKTTLVRRLAEHGRDVEAFLEAEIGTRAELADVMDSFRRTGEAGRDLLLEATARLAATYRSRGPAVVVMDMVLPFTPSLLAWGWSDDEILRFLADLRDVCDGIELVQVHLDGPARPALARAIAREDDGWLDWMIEKVNCYRDAPAPVTDLDTLIEYLEYARRRTTALLAHAPWAVVHLDADQTPAMTPADANEAISDGE